MKKTLAILLSLALVICMLPSVAFAATTQLTNTNVTLAVTTGIYNAAVQTPIVKVNVSGAVEDTDYTVTVSPAEVKNVGPYTVTVTAKEGSAKVSGVVTKTYTINKATIGNAVVTVRNGEKLINSADFTETRDASGKITYQLNESGKNKISVVLGKTELGSSEYTITGTMTAAKATSASIVVSAAESENFQASSKTIVVPVYNQMINSDSVVGGVYAEIPTASQTITYTGAALTPNVQVKTITAISQNGVKTVSTLSKGNQYNLEYYTDASYTNKVTEIKAVGNYYIKVVGTGTYAGYVQGGMVAVVGKSISNVSIVANNAIEGNAPVLTVKDGSTTLVEGTDYAIVENTVTKSATDKTNGAGTVTIQGTGNYTGSRTANYVVVYPANEITDAVVSTYISTINNKAYSGYYYNGQVQTPVITVKAGNKTLSTSDYSVEYTYTKDGKSITTSSPKDAAIYTVTVNGRGNYAGQRVTTHTINQYPLAEASISISQASATATPVAVVRTADGRATFLLNTDYTLGTPSVSTTSGLANVSVLSTATGNLSGAKYVSYSIVAKSIGACTITADASKPYTGAAIVPTVTVYDGSTRLYEGAAYRVTYKNAAGTIVSTIRDAGTYTILIEGLNGYTGSVSKTFTVTGNDLSGAIVSLNTTVVDATGLNVSLPTVLTVKVNGTLVSSANYKISYQDAAGNTIQTASKAGTYYLVVTGTGAYTGVAKAAFQIKGTDQVIVMTSGGLVKKYRNSEDFSVKATCTTSTLTYTSSNTQIATVSATGEVSLMGKAGVATITIKAPAVGKYNEAVKTVTVVARPYKAKVTSVKSPAKGSLKAYVAKQNGCIGYQLVVSKSSSFKSGTRTFKKITDNPKYTSSQSATYTGLKAGKYYVKARAMYLDADGDVAYGNYGAVQTVTVK